MNCQPVVLITGGGRGLGERIAKEFAAQGWLTAAGVRTPSETNAGNEGVWKVPLDVSNVGDAERAVRMLVDRWRRIDALVNNAGISRADLTVRAKLEDWTKILDVNLKGAWRCARAAATPMMHQGRGSIINIGSLTGRTGGVGLAAYSASKAALAGLTVALAQELGPHGIRVNTVLPGWLSTHLTAGTPVGRQSAGVLGLEGDIAEAARFVAFLAGMQHASGQVFTLDSRVSPWC